MTPVLGLLGSPAIATMSGIAPLMLRPKEAALLARLALAAEPLTRVDLAAWLFGDAEDPRGALRWHLSSVRSKLPPEMAAGIVGERDRIGARIRTDVEDFRRDAHRMASGEVRDGDHEVLALYRGDLLASVTVSASPAFDTWLYVEQEATRRLFRRATLAFARWSNEVPERGDPRVALAKLIEVDPYFEDGHVLLIESHEARSEPTAARAAYDVYQRVVRDDLQAEPRPELAERYEGSSPAGRPLPREELIPLRDITMHVVEWEGAEPCVLAVHGSAGSAFSFTALGERLAGDARVIAVDLRGHGFSDKPPAGYEMAHHVDDLEQLTEVMELEAPVVLGFSLGGAVAAALATRIRARGLILLEAAIGDREFLERRVPQAVVPTGETLELTFEGFDEYLQRWRAENRRYSKEAERWLERFARYELAPLADGRYRRRGLREALHAEWRSVVESDSLAILGSVRCPVLLVRAMEPWIGGEPWFTDEIIAGQQAACPHAEVLVVRRSNHASLIRDPEPALIEALKAFVAIVRHRSLS